MKEQIEIKERHCPPTKFDIEPFGTVYKVNNEALSYDYFIQLGTESEITWKPINYLLTELFSDLYENKNFIGELLYLYQDREKSIKTFLAVLEAYME